MLGLGREAPGSAANTIALGMRSKTDKNHGLLTDDLRIRKIKDRSANGTSASVGRAARITRSNSRGLIGLDAALRPLNDSITALSEG
jgi:hypothetical protein